jgi:hypothetical protein
MEQMTELLKTMQEKMDANRKESQDRREPQGNEG